MVTLKTIRTCLLYSFLIISPIFVSAQEINQKRPNILWITTEDISPQLGCYGDKFAHTPFLDQLASEGVMYNNAIASAPVCAPARSSIILECINPL